MLGARTKQINSYGKRSQRVVSVPDERLSRKEIPNIFGESEVPIQWAPVASRMRKRVNVTKPESSASASSQSPRVLHVQRRKVLMSPIRKKRPSTVRGRDAVFVDVEAEAPDQMFEAARKNSAPTKSVHSSEALRTPLAARTLNLPSSPAIARKDKRVLSDLSKKLHKPAPDVINVDIIVLDEDGKTVGMERRISRIRAEIKHNVRPSGHKAKPPNAVSTDSEDEPVIQPRRLPKAGRRLRVYSDDSESDDPPFSTPAPPLPRQADNDVTRPIQPRPSSLHPVSQDKPTDTQARRSIAHSPSLPSTRFVASQQRIRHKPPSLPYNNRAPSPIPRPRPLTPIRGLRSSRNAIAPPSPPTPSDFDSSIELSDIEFEPPPFPNTSPYLSDAAVPDYLKPLLKECHQEDCGVHEFSSFIKSFPYDPIVRSSWTEDEGGDCSFKKIGEASYSEVFGIGGVVLKIVPLRNESRANDGKQHQNNDIEEPATSEAKDVRKEIIVTRAMGEVCDGFVKLLKAYVVRGRYPELLLRLWDEYNEVKGSESTRPDSFSVSQVYGIIVLPNGGSDLEAYTFAHPRKTGWRQACSVFWQVTKALGHAEQLASFEHRDLHWGQILVKDLPTSAALQTLDLNPRTQDNPLMDDVTHGVQATIIDLGLSRMDAADADGFEKVYWTTIDEEVFMGEGDYQFDIYRIMREYVGSEWQKFNPFTNVMWLHYIALKLLQSKDLKPPSARAVQATAEKECYSSLLEMEKLLAKCVSEARAGKKGVKKGKGRGKIQVPASIGFSCAGAVVEYGVSKGWIMPTA